MGDIQKIQFAELGIDYIHGPDIEFELGRNQIIWAPNGTAKSSICRAIAAKKPKSIMLVDYESCLDSFRRRNKKSISIGTSIQRISELQKRIGEIDDEAGIRKALKSFGITNEKNAYEIIGIKQSVKSLVTKFDQYRLTDGVHVVFDSVLPEESHFFVQNYSQLRSLVSMDDEIELLKQAFIQHAADLLEFAFPHDSDVCPICGSHLDSSLLERIGALKGDREMIYKGLAAKLDAQVSTVSASDAEARLRRLVEAAHTCNDADDLLLFCMAGGDKCRAEFLCKLSREKRSLVKELKGFAAKRDKSFKRLKGRESQLKAFFASRFGVRSLKADDATKTIQVDLDRAIDTYSTGEINLMLLMVKVQEFRSGDIQTLLVDDPLSSLDVANQYQVIFELINATSDPNAGNVVMLTHNLNAMNVAMAQFRGAYELYGMERIGNELMVKRIACDASLTFRSFLEKAQKSERETICALVHYLEAASVREDDADTESDSAEDEGTQSGASLHDVFHYSRPGIPVAYKRTSLCNDYLIELVDRYSPDWFMNLSFEEACVLKAGMLVASRVWLESKLRAGAQ